MTLSPLVHRLQTTAVHSKLSAAEEVAQLLTKNKKKSRVKIKVS